MKIFFFFAILFAACLGSSRAQDTWIQKAGFGGGARHRAVGFSIGSKGYIGTGNEGIYPYKNDFWEYDPSTNAWTQKADYVGGDREYAVGFSVGSKGYVGTGMSDANGTTKDFWEYNPSTNLWTQKANFGGGPIYVAVGFSIGTKGYICTGQDTGILTKKLWEYDPVADTWTQKADFGGTAREGAVGFSIGSKGYIGTGIDQYHPWGTSDFWEYDPAADAWTQKADYHDSTEYAAGFSIGSKGYIGTGYHTNGYYLRDFWEYDPATNAWIQKAEFGGIARWEAIGFSIGTKGYMGTGEDINNYDCQDFWEYTPGTAISSITTGAISGSPFCPEAPVSVPFTSTGTFNSGNVYTAQLSNNKGSFAAPTAIGTLSTTLHSGTIAATIPSKPKAGTKYRIRVTSSNPVVTGSNNGTNLQLYACAKVTALSASSITSTSATLNWTGVSCVANYKVQYRKQGNTSWTTKSSTTNSYTITGLHANTTYEYHVKTNCTESGSSNSGFTSIQTFTTTLRLGSGSVSTEEMMSIYPNPAKDHATIQFTLQQSSHVYISMYDISGKEIETLMNDHAEQGDHSVQLNTDQFSKGIYFVKMISDFGIENVKLVVQ